MLRNFLVLFSCVSMNTIHTKGQNYYYGASEFNDVYEQINPAYTVQSSYSGKASIQLYYEALCPSCRYFDSKVLKQTVLELGSSLDIQLHPYGNAKTIGNAYGGFDFISQHGPEETYGNKLHACAVEVLQNITTAVLFNSCMMDDSQAGQGSDDAAADVCGSSLNINAEVIKQCAKSYRGTQLLKYHGEESMKVGFKSVPTILVNGVTSSQETFNADVRKALGRSVY